MKKTDLRRGLARPKPPASSPPDPMDDLMDVDPAKDESEGQAKIIPISRVKGEDKR